ncbi:hypothetical protein AMTRI_Chr09g42310 [Amborella trichopoda]
MALQKKPSRQLRPSSIPFSWEEKPGIPKKTALNSGKNGGFPVKMIISVPFKWEEKPGKPILQSPHLEKPPRQLPEFEKPLLQWLESLVNFRQTITRVSNPGESHRPLPLPPSRQTSFPSPSSSSSSPCNSVILKSPVSSHFRSAISTDSEETESESSQEEEELFDLDLEAFAFDSYEKTEDEEALISGPSLMANCLSTVAELSSAVPFAERKEHNKDGNGLVTGSHFRWRNSSRSELSFRLETDGKFQYKDWKTKDKVIVKGRTPTLGELIFKSCRRRRRAVVMDFGMQSPPRLETTMKRRTGCWMCGISNNATMGSP